MEVGWMNDLEMEQKIRAGGREGEIYRKLKLLRERYGDLVEKRYPKIPRRVSGYNLDQLIPGKDVASTSRARWSAAREPASRFSKPRSSSFITLRNA
jgi:hypothetical protein